jgi:ribosomal protein S18 acetylase RimI-like enzyme
MALEIAPETDSGLKRGLLETLTARLPQWFGRPDSNRHYAEQAESLEGWVAWRDGQGLGLLLVRRHGPASAEIYWLGVDPEHHRQGVGRGLAERVAGHLREQGVKFLFVVTLHPDDPYEPYRRTRHFYESLGFEFALSMDYGAERPPDDLLAWYLKLL